MAIAYALEPDLSASEFIDVLRRSTLAERRPVDDLPRIETMLRKADLILTARSEGLLVGVARSITDFAYCCYLSDLAVDEAWQGKGIGRALMLRTRTEAMKGGTDWGGEGPKRLRCFLFAAPKARDYYPHVGLTAMADAWEFTNLE